MPIYQEIHPLKLISNGVVEKAFLKNLHAMIPRHINVIVVTDAGFKRPWFQAVRPLNWDYVGRVRDKINFSFDAETWHKSSDFIGRIKTHALYLGFALLGKTTKTMQTHLYAYATPRKGRKRIRRKYYNDGHPDKDEKYGRAHREPWILASSLSCEVGRPKRIVNIDKTRMQIEQNFRDLKNQRFGFGLRDSKTEKISRLEIRLLVGFIATVVRWLLGLLAESQKLHYGFQANTKRDGRTLSLFYLGKQIVKHEFRRKKCCLQTACRQLERCISETIG